MCKALTIGDNALALKDQSHNWCAQDVVHKARVEGLALQIHVVLLCK